VLCSTLFVVDSVTRQIEEVGEGVDYGVKKRQVGTPGGQQGRQEDEEKFLKGVRICRDCRPILLCVILNVISRQMSNRNQASTILPTNLNCSRICEAL
jgi:hypothetical protein